MYTCQCEGLQMGQRNGALFKEIFAFRKCPLIARGSPQTLCTCVHYAVHVTADVV